MKSVHSVEVIGYGSTGDGIAKLPDGKVAFVREAARGDILDLLLVEEKARSARAEITRIVHSSPHRIEPDCKAFPKCGGCDFRHISYEEELWLKLSRVNDALQRIGGLSIRAKEILSTGEVDGYRNKATLHSDSRSRGFYASGSHDIVHIDSCKLLREELNRALISFPLKVTASYRSVRSGSGRPRVEELDGLLFEVSGFFQVNTGAATLLYRKAREFAGLTADETLLDLYCGVGSLSLYVGRDAGYALGIEINPKAVATARNNALRNGFSHIDFIAADVGKWDSTIQSPDCITVNPPRKGLSAKALERILSLSPKRIVYLSCDPATLARDLRLLQGYAAAEVCAVDMFPRTANVECCVKLQKEQP